MHIEFKL